MRRVSNLSHKRAAAADPLLHQRMLRKFLEDDAQLIQKGFFQGGSPRPEDIYNMDEVGMDPTGRPLPTYRIFNGPDRRFRSKSGEKAPFRASVVLCIRADGEVLPPLIVHKGGTDTSLRGDFVIGLHPSFMVTCTKSGYIDKGGFRAFCSMLMRESNAGPNNGKLLYLDGYDAHFDYEAWKCMFEKYLRLRFLKAMGSAHDAPLDLGYNAIFKIEYDFAYYRWSRRNPQIAITPAAFNEVVTEAYFAAKARINRVQAIKKSFLITQLCPLTDVIPEAEYAKRATLSAPYRTDIGDAQEVDQQLANIGAKPSAVVAFDATVPLRFVPSSSSEAMTSFPSMVSSNSSTTAQCTTSDDNAILASTVSELSAEPTTLSSVAADVIATAGESSGIASSPMSLQFEAVDLSNPPEQVGLALAADVRTAKPGTPLYISIVSGAAYAAMNQRTSNTAAEIAANKAREKKAKAVKVPKDNGPGSLRNPNTKMGLCVVEDVLAQMQDIEAAKLAQDEDKKAKSSAAAEKKNNQHQLEIQLAEEVRQRAMNPQKHANDWQTLPVGHIRAAYRVFLPAALRTPPATKKADMIEAIKPQLTHPAAIHAGHAGDSDVDGDSGDSDGGGGSGDEDEGSRSEEDDDDGTEGSFVESEEEEEDGLKWSDDEDDSDYDEK